MSRQQGVTLRAYLLLSRAVAPLAPWFLRRRLARGREDPSRWREKLGETDLIRPKGTLVWMHAVGLGEVMALSGLIAAMLRARPDLNFLVTSSARSSAEVFSRNLPPRTQHQYLPLDAPRPVSGFLDHWRPDLSVWAEQDLWPRLVVDAAQRGIPLAMVNARMNARAFSARNRAQGMFRNLYRRFKLITAQDKVSARHLELLGAPPCVAVTGSLKPSSPPLADPVKERELLAGILGTRKLWLAASTHADDEQVAFSAAARLPDALLILVPRLPDRSAEIADAAKKAGLRVAIRSAGELPDARTQVYLADTLGELGLWYRLCPVALVGGGFGPVGGHNPWEPAHLGVAILHGPDTANFAADYADLHAHDAARLISGSGELVSALSDPDLRDMGARALALAGRAGTDIDDLSGKLLGLLK